MHYLLRFLCFFLMLSGCASYQDKAEKSMKAGNFYKAREYWALALKKDPDNAKALEGKKLSEKEIIGKNLISLRSLRISGQMKKALSKALYLKKLTNSWNHPLDIHGGNFFKNELKKLWPFFQEDIYESLAKGYPLKGDHSFKLHKSLFEFYGPEKLGPIYLKIKDAGKKKCGDFIKNSNGLIYFSLFASKFCFHFDPDTDISSLPHELDEREFYKNFDWDLKIKGLSKNLEGSLVKKLTRVFHESPFYYSKSKKFLKINLVGKLLEKKKVSPVQRVHQYEVDIPYTEVVKELKWKNVPFEKEEKVCVKNVCKNQKVVRYKKESYYEPVAQNKIRKEKRYFNYQANQIDQVMEFDLTGEIIFNQSNGPISFSKRKSFKGIEHNFNLPDIGLSPHRAKLGRINNWYGSKLRVLSTNIRKLFKEKWKSLYCEGQNINLSMEPLGDRLFRCRRGGPFLLKAIEKWHQTHLGLGSKETEFLLGAYFY
ncbi:MAG: hypothetical protein VYD54_12305 [Bdellovibrionota bacterium]|nr:hypothetical protein [Bdellovibrionota bacterium]